MHALLLSKYHFRFKTFIILLFLCFCEVPSYLNNFMLSYSLFFQFYKRKKLHLFHNNHINKKKRKKNSPNNKYHIIPKSNVIITTTTTAPYGLLSPAVYRYLHC